MFLLLLKTTKNACTSLDFVGMYETKEKASRYISQENGPLEPSAFGNYRMIGSQNGITPETIEETKEFQGSTYLLVEF